MYKTGHSRKYLDTYEAMQSYIEHLKPGGLLIFDNQPCMHKIQSLQQIFQKQGRKDFNQSIIVLSRLWGKRDSIIVSLQPFSTQEISFIKNNFSEQLLFAPSYHKNLQECVDIIKGKTKKIFYVTDNRPFISSIDFKNYNIFTTLSRLQDIDYYSGWVKTTTLLGTFVVFSAFLLLLLLSNSNKKTLPAIGILILSGFSYMLCQITYMAKLELFIGNPLYSMALLLCLFLLGNGLGSAYIGRPSTNIKIQHHSMITAIIILLTSVLIETFNRYFLHLPLFIKIILVVACIMPTAFCLGIFYPFIVQWLSKKNYTKIIPSTYGISAISSVLGATYAMTMIINLGYFQIILQAVAGYLLLFLITQSRLN